MITVGGRVFDWRARFDERSLHYRPPASLLAGRIWPAGQVLDQGRSRGCVGFGCAGGRRRRRGAGGG
jgi:hypothetical protein